MKVSLIQMHSTANKIENLQSAKELISKACQQDKPDIVCLPEMFNFLCGNPDERKLAAEVIGDDQTSQLLQELAQEFNVVVHGGSICERDGDEYFNTTVVYGRNGEELARYRKIHLFDVTTPDGFEYKESDFYQPGENFASYDVDNIHMGCTICFDLRFGEQYLALAQQGAKVIFIPSAFTYPTGKAHWEVLLRARAVETQTFIIAPAQTGKYLYNGAERSSWGHSMAVDPWGNIMAQMDEQPGFVTVELDFKLLDEVRTRMPVLKLR